MRPQQEGDRTPKSLIAAIHDYVIEERKPWEKRNDDIGCPLPLAVVRLAERFGHWPWEIETAPQERVEYYLAVISAEAAARDDIEDDN